jgi:pantetheine-phosphate adenylyltransferase
VKYAVVATGGTFDEFHLGHLALLSKAFQSGAKVIIGVSSDEFAARRKKKIRHNYEQRVSNLRKTISKEFGVVNYEIAKLDADFGPAVTSGDVGALVTSSETRTKADVLNKMRQERKLPPVEVVSVEMVNADDGLPISSTRIRAGEIDNKGVILQGEKKETSERTEDKR